MSVVNLGVIETTAAAAAAIREAGEDLAALLAKYERGDWGDAGARQRNLNDLAVQNRLPIFSTYTLAGGAQILITTSGDRSKTSVVLPSEVEIREVSSREGYAKWSTIYDAEGNALIAVEQTAVNELLSGLQYRSALDAATGTGGHALNLARTGIRVTAFDESEEMLTVARRKAQEAELAIDFRLASLNERLPFGAEQFDLVTCTLALCHVPNLAAAVQEFARVLRSGGCLLLTDFHPDSVAHGWKTIFWEGHIRYTLPNYPYRRADYVDAVVAAGFSDERVLDIPFREIPPGLCTEDMREEFGALNFCLAILARKQSPPGV